MWRWVGGQSASLLGDQIFYTALAWAAVQVASPTMAGIVLAAGTLPRAILMLGGGVIVDRVGPLRVLITSDATRFVVMTLAGLWLLQARPSVILLTAVGVVFGVVDAFGEPATGALPPRIVHADLLLPFQGLRAFIHRITGIGGGPLGGFVVAAWGVPAAFLVNAATFGVSVVAFATMTLLVTPSKELGNATAPDADPAGWRGFLDDIRRGVRYVATDRVLRACIAVAFLVELGFTGALNVGVPLLAKQNGWGATGIGAIEGALGLGAVVASLITLRATGAHRWGGSVVGGACILTAAGLAALPISPNVIVAAAAASVMGLCVGALTAVVYATVQMTASPEMLGRTMSVFALVTTSGLAPVSYALTGILTDASGLITAFMVSAGIAATASVFASRCSPYSGGRHRRLKGQWQAKRL